MKKPAIPPVPQTGKPRTNFDSAVKQRLEIICGDVGGKIKLSDDAKLDEIRSVVKQILSLLQ